MPQSAHTTLNSYYVESPRVAAKSPVDWSQNRQVEQWLLEQVVDIQSGTIFDPDLDMFEQGFDSFGVTFLCRRIIGAVLSSTKLNVATKITQNTIYLYPTISQISVFIAKLVSRPEESEVSKNKVAEMEQMIETYCVGLDTKVISDTNTTRPAAPVVVLLTGSTGNLGSQILTFLLEDINVDKVYTLNRPSSKKSIFDRHREKFAAKGHDERLLQSSKLILVESNVSQPNLGLENALYEEMRSSITIIIHNAWGVHFIKSLVAYESNVRGTRNLVDFARSSSHSSTMRFLFTSSISSGQSWDKNRGPFPEEVVEDPSVAVGNGYGESKYIAERILAKSGLRATFFRPGQISGAPPNGAWETTEWFPTLMKSSLALGVFPKSNGVASYTPMDVVAKVILDAAFSEHQPSIALNIAHPLPISWESVVSAVRDAIVRERKLSSTPELIPFREWFSLLEKRAKIASAADIQAVPAIKLLEFFRYQAHADVKDAEEAGGLKIFATEKAHAISGALRTVGPIKAVDAGLWVKYWNTAGLFD